MSSRSTEGLNQSGRDDRALEYWRDHLVSLLEWGTAANLLIIGWMVSTGDRFEPIWNSDHWSNGTAVASFLLLLTLPACQLVFYRYVRWIYDHHLTDAIVDATMHPRGLVLQYVVWTSIAMNAIAWAVCCT